MFVCLFVCMELTKIHISEPIWTRLCTCLAFGLEETVGYVWTRNSRPLRTSGPLFFGGHCRIMGTRWLPVRPFSAIPLYPWFQLVFTWRHRHDVVADGGVIHGSLISVILAGVSLPSRRRQSSTTSSYPLFRRVFASRHGYYVQQGDRAIHHSVISLILVPVSVTYRKSRPCRQQLRVPTPSVLHCRECVGYAVTWTGSMCLQFGTSSDGKKVTKELQLYK